MPTVDEVEALGGDLRVAAHGVFVVGVAAVDEDVAGDEEGFEVGDGLVDGVAGGTMIQMARGAG